MRVRLLAAALVCSAVTTLHADDVGLKLRFGVGDRQPAKWDGGITVSKGSVSWMSGWRFERTDKVDGDGGWTVSTRRTANRRRTNQPNRAQNRQSNAPVLDNGVIIGLSGVDDSTTVEIKTQQGDFSLALRDLPYGTIVPELKGRLEIERTAAPQALTDGGTDDDFPAAAAAPDGTVYVAYVSFTPGLDRDERARSFSEAPEDLSYLATPPGGDQVSLRILKDNSWSSPLDVTDGHGDVYKCAVAVDGAGKAWVVWSENRDDNFDVWARSFDGRAFSEPVRLSSDKGSDHSPVAATDSAGRVWIAWQGARDNVFQIHSRHQTGSGWSEPVTVSTQTRNCWYPAIAAERGGDGRVAIGWDTYEKGDYDVFVREFDTDGNPEPARPVANSWRYEARAALTYDAEGNLWVAWEESGETWGKNWGALVLDQGIPLYQDRQIGLRVLKDGHWMESVGDYTAAMPDLSRRRGARANRVAQPEPQAATRRQGQEAQTQGNVPYNNISRVVCDNDGRVWVLVRTRQSDFRTPLGTVWLEYAVYCNGDDWVGPILLPHSDDLIYNLPAAVAMNDGGLLVAHSTDHRQDRQLQRLQGGGNQSLEAKVDPYINHVYITRLAAPSDAEPAALRDAADPPSDNPQPSPGVAEERAAIERCRTYRANVDGKELRILRGEFHRHTEISGDGGGDGPLEDMWRYAIDVASMDWIGCGDHDNGAGREYPWWLTQKTTDMYHLPGSFDPVFSYERSVRYPEGHRNVIFPYRGIRTLPRLPISDRDVFAPAPDTNMLYRYLHQFGGVCAVHTSATGMGTDWRNNDPEVEPFVEIYQGCRQNYERLAAPRAPTADDALGGWEPKGFVNLALNRGYHLSFESSSDHRSTHISYGLVYAEEASRQGIFNAMKKRHVYAATDNIVADFRCTDSAGGEHMLGDEFVTAEAPTLSVKLQGTAPFANVVIVKNDEYVERMAPRNAEVDFTWTDPDPTPGKVSYYYVRGEQDDGELVWASPMYIEYKPQQ
jgi:hypothetical protein